MMHMPVRRAALQHGYRRHESFTKPSQERHIPCAVW